jgi:RHH-type proline utilization regulon transcriptional repressor/proline dehydrogenase/delta 1-pyrroline-5-carboxylate dehydrogenase
MPPSSDPRERIEKAISLARTMQSRATQLQTPHERRQQAELDRMLQNPDDKATLVQLTDEAFRSKAVARTAEHLTHILDVQGVPRFFSPLDRALLRGFQTFGGFLPGVAVPLVKDHMQRETANVVLPAELPMLSDHLRARQREGVRMNLNLLGEAVLGEEEAARRLDQNLAALQLPEVEVISVKISTLYSQIAALGRAHTLRVLCDRLELLHREAAHLRFTRPDGSSVPKFIYLDMEEYRDLELTAAAFRDTLDRPGLRSIAGGIALQAYLPDSARVQRELNAWARRRVARGGAPITIRLVKGANLEAERVEAALRDWPQAPFQSKRETDANFQRMLHEALRPENLEAVRIGVASHNLFSLAYAMVLAEELEAGDRVQFEMLEGMANHQRRALLEHPWKLLLYAPACRREGFLNAIGYLVRRLDENTGPENFLRHAFRLSVDSPEWRRLEGGFREAFDTPVSDNPRRTQNRLTERFESPVREMSGDDFHNEPDTDWALPPNGAWAERIVARTEPGTADIPLVIAGETVLERSDVSKRGECRDPSRQGTIVARFAQADDALIDRAIACARRDPDGWRRMDATSRSEVLGRVAMQIRRGRADLVWAALANGGKTLAESDPEVSEAVDFLELYRASARYFFKERRGADADSASPRGVVVVVPPWNFPIAIPAGGMAAALAAGNTVILKPASDTILVAWELCQCFWRAGVPKTVLQFAPCPGSGAAQRLVTHPEVDAVILTGGTATAQHLLKTRPELRLFAETGGKNATIVTSLSDRELAIKHVVHSAFSHSGQKCSATSLLLLEAEVYEDPDFKRMLVDAVSSLHVGSAWELQTRVGPLIRPPSGDLENALKTLEVGESWALRPREVDDNPHLWSPGIKYGVQPGSYTHRTEFFGPVLGVMRYDRLEEAIAIVDQTGYGLTSGLHTLDEREQSRWRARIRAGNLYVNRGTTGAVVLRQPFGGTGRSCFGPGLKAGGPNYVAQFMKFDDALPGAPVTAPFDVRQGPRLPHIDALARGIATDDRVLQPIERNRILTAIESYRNWWNAEFAQEHDHFRLLGQDNTRRYLSVAEIRVRIGPGDAPFDIVARVAAASVTGARVIVSHVGGTPSPILDLLERATESWAAAIEFVEETDEELVASVRAQPPHAVERIRFSAPSRVPQGIRLAAAEAGVYLADEPVRPDGRVELLWYLKEQSISSDYHRYGNLGARAGEQRRQPS